jgi:asparagine synthase (glutamine-hydrolysing)
MCGIVGGRGTVDEHAIAALTHRGPDAGGAWQGVRYWLGHRRLSIIDVGERSNQPFTYGDVVLVYNGELWNYAELRARLQAEGDTFHTTGDTEVVAAALNRWGPKGVVFLDGMFAMAWTTDGGRTLCLTRDRFGEVPLHWDGEHRFASELKALPANSGAAWFPPGALAKLDQDGGEAWYYYEVAPKRPLADTPESAVRARLVDGVNERRISDVGFCVLLSGGIDSSAVAYELAALGDKPVAYFAKGAAGGDPADERCARDVAAALGLTLRVVPIPAPSSGSLREIVRAIEMPHKAQIEIAWACWWLARVMRADGQRVTFSGEGSDELWASYGSPVSASTHFGIEKHGWYGYRRKLFTEQHRKNFARCNKIFMSQGVECRLPFLSTPLVELALGLTREEVGTPAEPKAVMARAYAGLLPDSVLRRKKMTFQEGAGLTELCASAVADPARFYRAEFSAAYPGATP